MKLSNDEEKDVLTILQEEKKYITFLSPRGQFYYFCFFILDEYCVFAPFIRRYQQRTQKLERREEFQRKLYADTLPEYWPEFSLTI